MLMKILQVVIALRSGLQLKTQGCAEAKSTVQSHAIWIIGTKILHHHHPVSKSTPWHALPLHKLTLVRQCSHKNTKETLLHRKAQRCEGTIPSYCQLLCKTWCISIPWSLQGWVWRKNWVFESYLSDCVLFSIAVSAKGFVLPEVGVPAAVQFSNDVKGKSE